jgi:hypothetical protein
MSIYRQQGRLFASHERAMTPFRFAVPKIPAVAHDAPRFER